MLAVDTEILNKSMRLEQLQRSSEDDRSNPLKRFRALVAGNRARIAALAAFMTPHDDLGHPFDFTKNCRIVNKAAKKKWKQVEAAIRLEQLKLTAGLAMVC